jgi:hypothetical protein
MLCPHCSTKTRWRRTLAAAIALVALVATAGCLENLTSPTTATPTVHYYSVEYKVTGTATSSASLTYANSAGGTSQSSNAALPWSFKFSAKSGQFLYISAQNNDKYGCVDAVIVVDGKDFKTGSGCGAYAIGTASGSAPD